MVKNSFSISKELFESQNLINNFIKFVFKSKIGLYHIYVCACVDISDDVRFADGLARHEWNLENNFIKNGQIGNQIWVEKSFAIIIFLCFQKLLLLIIKAVFESRNLIKTFFAERFSESLIRFSFACLVLLLLHFFGSPYTSLFPRLEITDWQLRDGDPVGLCAHSYAGNTA